MTDEGYFVKYSYARREEGVAVLSINELYERSKQFPVKVLSLVDLLVEQDQQGLLTRTQFEDNARQIASMTSEPKIMLAFINNHPSKGVRNQNIEIQI